VVQLRLERSCGEGLVEVGEHQLVVRQATLSGVGEQAT
jgi:hypothetical protein